MIYDDPDIYLSDFSVEVRYQGVVGRGIYDSPSEIVADGMVIATDYSVLVKTSDFGSVQYNEKISVDGETFLVREPHLQADGLFTKITLSKDYEIPVTTVGGLLDRIVNVDLPEDT